jgi:LmbE family N-acetylglucosaminyl deacetylase
MMSSFYRHVYLSPHYDDAALSCGGLIHQQTQAGELALALTVFAAPPESDENLSPFARGQHESWGALTDAVAVRQAEDRAALALLGADYLRLKFADCIYRGEKKPGTWFYTSNDDLFGAVKADDLPLVAEITEAVMELIPNDGAVTLYAPLAVGHHVDHQLVNMAGRQLQLNGYRLAFYADYPYADPFFEGRYAPGLAETLAAYQNADLHPALHPLIAADLAAKVAAVQAYGSQMGILFDGPIEAKTRLTHYAAHVGQGQPAACIWLPD